MPISPSELARKSSDVERKRIAAVYEAYEHLIPQIDAAMEAAALRGKCVEFFCFELPDECRANPGDLALALGPEYAQVGWKVTAAAAEYRRLLFHAVPTRRPSPFDCDPMRSISSEPLPKPDPLVVPQWDIRTLGNFPPGTLIG